MLNGTHNHKGGWEMCFFNWIWLEPRKKGRREIRKATNSICPIPQPDLTHEEGKQLFSTNIFFFQEPY